MSREESAFEIWDVHVHLAGIAGQTPADRLGKLLEYADRLGIRRVCVFMGTTFQYDPSPEEMAQANREVRQAIERFPDRAFGFVYLNPNHLSASLDELNRHVADGPMVGVKLWVAKRCADPALDPLVERATELKAVVLQHTWLKTTGNLPGESTPQDLAVLAGRHPETTFIAAHSGGNWEYGLRAVRPYGNILVDLCGFDPTAGVTEMAVRTLGAERILFGSDAPGRSFATQLGKVLGADISADAKRLILGENLRRILRPILQQKGIRL
ncbi:MAG: amidohydrolase family protein [Thermogutta sp.]|jgi:predicted TIM-barrel fold metal-dependent hydrolase